MKESTIISQAVNVARDMLYSSPADFYPEIFVKDAQKIAKDLELVCEVFGEKYLDNNKMLAMHSVVRASIHE
ncbi:leucyl aminopeptidase, partial [Aliarcobacter lanthieri]